MALLRFDGYQLDTETCELTRDGELLPLAPQPAQILAILAARPGRTVSRSEIKRQVWGEAFVEADQGLNSCIRKIRTLLQDDPNHPRFIRTLPRRGYRFIAAVESSAAEENKASAADRLRAEMSPIGRYRWPAIALLTVALLLVFGGRLLRDSSGTGPLPSQDDESGSRLLVILPFVDEGNETGGYFAQGLVEETIARLGRVDPSRLAVLAHSSSSGLWSRVGRPTAGADPAVLRQMGLAGMGIDFAAEGRLIRGREGAQVEVRLLDAGSGAQVAAERFGSWDPESLPDGSDLAGRIAAWLAAMLVPEELPPPVSDPPLSSELYEEYLQGLHRLRTGGGSGYGSAIEAFRTVVREVPTHAASWTGLAEAELWSSWFGAEDPSAAVDRARVAAHRALELDPRSAVAQSLLGYAALYVDFDFREAERRFARAVSQQAGSARAQSWYAAYLSAVGRHDEALERAALARRLDPLSMAVRADLCWLSNYARRYDAALTACEAALALQPDNAWSSLGKLEALRQMGRTEDATRTALQLVEFLMRRASAKQGEARPTPSPETLQGALLWLEGALAASGNSFHAASMAAAAGEGNRALDHLDAAFDRREMLLVYLGVDPRFDEIRSEGELVARLAQWGLEAPETRGQTTIRP
ncbi:MAG: winged helix-turn-helix domain-containing protein [Thermoanaerobaculia bacterium]|nr:winged helix-turn-helix domain-containing protein [Thermoanaerobaculia bacterium]